MIRIFLTTASVLTVTACASTPEYYDDTSNDTEQQACAADTYQVLVSQPIAEVHTDSLPRPNRVYGQGDGVTMDFRPDRLNIVVGDNGQVIEVSCG